MYNAQIIHHAGLEIVIKRKAVKYFRLRVLFAKARCELSVPQAATIQQIQQVLASKTAWLHQHTQQFTPIKSNFAGARQVNLLGKPYHLCFNAALNTTFTISENTITLKIDRDSDLATQHQALHALYRHELQQVIPKLLAKAVDIVGIAPNQWSLRKMHTRWGSCNIDKKRIWLSTYLAAKSQEVILYVIIHELVHLYERYHNDRFYNYMQKFCPNYQQLDKELQNLY